MIVGKTRWVTYDTISKVFTELLLYVWPGPFMTRNATADGTQSVHQRVEAVLNLIRPAVQSDGGDVELVEVTAAGIVRIRLHGACVGCPSSNMTLQIGIERNLVEKVPEVVAVEQVH
jgi:Fe-S cluster biogenesis protein NfuA